MTVDLLVLQNICRVNHLLLVANMHTLSTNKFCFYKTDAVFGKGSGVQGPTALARLDVNLHLVLNIYLALQWIKLSCLFQVLSGKIIVLFNYRQQAWWRQRKQRLQPSTHLSYQFSKQLTGRRRSIYLDRFNQHLSFYNVTDDNLKRASLQSLVATTKYDLLQNLW